MNKIFTILFFIFSITYFTSFAQSTNKEIETSEQLWLRYNNQTRFNNKFGIFSDINWRTTDHFVNQKYQFITHYGLMYYISENVKFTAGYTYSYLYPDKNLPDRPEHRPWQQLWWKQNYNWFQTNQSLRFEQRFRRKVKNNELTEEYSFNYRIRYNFSLLIPLKGHKIETKTPYLIISDEIFINAGKEIVYNYFDSNRFFAGLGYQFSKYINFQFGYMNLYQQEASGYKFKNINAIRFYIFHTLDFRKNDNK